MHKEIEKDKKDKSKLEIQELREKKRVLTKLLENTDNGLKVSAQIIRALSSSIEFDLSFDHAMLEFNIANHGEEWIDIDSISKLNAIQDKLSELLYLDHMIALSGLDFFRESIMNNHIDLIFSSAKAGKPKFSKGDLKNLLNNLSKK